MSFLVFFIFSNFYLFLFIYFLGCIIFSGIWIYSNLFFYFYLFQFKKLKQIYYIYFLISLDFDFGMEIWSVQVLNIWIFLIYFYFFTPMYLLGWLLFYSLWFISSNNIVDFDEIFIFLTNCNFTIFFVFYIFGLVLLNYFFLYSKTYFFIINYLDFPLLNYFLFLDC